MTLGSWFRDYVYIPLGGNRVSKIKWFRNILIVWGLTGLWHGASWNFVLWGVYFGVILILEKAFLLKLLEKLPQFLRHFYTLFLVVLGFLIFSYTDFAEGWQAFQALFGVGCDVLITASMLYHILHLLPLLALAMLGATPLPHTIFQKVVSDRPRLQPLVPLLTLFGLILCTAYLVDSTFSPFAYTQF